MVNIWRNHFVFVILPQIRNHHGNNKKNIMMEPNAAANRINWIDWAKAIAITFVVFGHIPEERGSFLLNFIVTFHMPLFFFISGYLTKKEYFSKETFKKYTHTLIIPYFIYNIITYPFWAFRHIIENPNDRWLEFVKPILGTIFIQQTTFCSKPLNGVTWFLVALLIKIGRAHV